MTTTTDFLGRVLAERYRLESVLGAGASGQVYAASDVVLRRQVAIKLLHPALASDGAFLRRFRAEAQAAASLHHPHVMAVFDWGEDDHGPFLVLEYLGGGSLREMLDAHHLLSVEQAVTVGYEAAEALAYAHARGFVHRDVKPANLLFDEEGRLRVADFGLARALAEAAWTEPQGAVLGTARYAAPEQAEGRSLDGRADVYALALVLYEAVTGRVPFSADTTIATLMARVGARLPVEDSLGRLGELLAEAGSPDLDERLDAAAFAERLGELRNVLPEPEPLPLSQPERRPLEVMGTAADATEIGTAFLSGGSSRPTGEQGAPETGSGNGLSEPGMLGGGISVPRGARGQLRGSAHVGSRTSRRVPRWVLVAVAVLVVAAVLAGGGAYAVVRLKLLTPSRPVPAIAGMALPAARTSLAREHLGVKVTGRRYDVSLPAGSVITQLPRARTSLKEGSDVSAVVSLGPPPVRVPSLATLSGCQAVDQALVSAHLVPRCTTATSTTVPAGRVVSWEPHSKSLWGAQVAVVVSAGLPTVSVPNLAGTTCTGAEHLLASVHLAGTCTEEYSTSVPAGQVVSWSPPTSATWGSTVTVATSLGPPMAQVPNLYGDTVSQAVSALSARGLVAGSVYGPAGGHVFYTLPASGQWIRQGLSVELYTQ